jgi:WD40 repeat protein
MCLAGYDVFISYSHSTDERLAPAIRDGLQKLARPWNKRRALNVFLDKSSLEVSSGLKDSLKRKLADTRWLVLLLSEESARSEWVGEEIASWAATKPAGSIALVHTGGELAWGDSDFDWERSSAAPRALQGIFEDEPLWLDLRWAQDAPDLDIRGNARFKDDLATLAAPLHGRSKDELVGEDLEQFRRARLLRRVMISGLVVLTLASAGLGAFAWHQWGIAIDQRDASDARRLAAVAQSQAANGTDVAALLAVESRAIAPMDEALDSLFSVLSRPIWGRASLLDPGGAVQGLAFSPAGVLAAASRGAERWGPNYERLPSLGETETMAVVFNHDGSLLASAGAGGTVLLWNMKTGEKVELPKRHEGYVLRLAFDPEGSLLASGGADKKVQLWDVASGTPLDPPLPGHDDVVMGLAFHPLEPLLASAGPAGVRLWDLTTRALKPPTLGSDATSVAFDRHGFLYSGHGDGVVRTWDEDSPEAGDVLVSAHDHAAVMSMAFGSDDRFLATGSVDSEVAVWDGNEGFRLIGERLTGHIGPVYAVAFNADGSVLASGSGGGQLRLWDLAMDEALGAILPGTRDVLGLVASTEESMLAMFTRFGELQVWNADERTMELKDAPPSPWEVGISPSGSLVALAGEDGTIQVFGETSVTLGRHADVSTLAVSKQGLVASGAWEDGTVRLWDVESGGAPRELAGPVGGIRKLAFSRDGALLASAGVDGTVRIWDMKKPESKGKLIETHTESVRSVAFDADLSLIVSGGDDGTLRLWDLKQDRAKGEPMHGHVGRINGVAFSPTTALLASVGFDQTLRLWDVESGQEIGPALSFGDMLMDVQFSGDGSLLATGSGDGLRIFPVPAGFPRLACERLGRDLSPDEWKEYLGPDRPHRRQCDAENGAAIFGHE